MSAQILLLGRLQGAEDFLLAPPADRDNRAFEARWVDHPPPELLGTPDVQALVHPDLKTWLGE